MARRDRYLVSAALDDYLLADGSRALSGDLLLTDSAPEIYSQSDGAVLSIYGDNAAASKTTLVTMDPDGSVDSYYAGLLATATADHGLKIYDPDGNDPSLHWYQDDGTTRNFFITAHSGGITYFRNELDSATMTFQGYDSGSAITTLATMDPDGQVTLYNDGVTAFRTNDGSAASKLSYSDVKDFDGTFRDVGYAIHTLMDFNTNTTAGKTHFTGKALRDTETTTPRTLTLANDSTIPLGAEVEIWNGQTGTSGTALTIAQGTGVTLRWYGGSGTISTGNRTLAIAGYCKIRKYNNTVYWITGVGIT